MISSIFARAVEKNTWALGICADYLEDNGKDGSILIIIADNYFLLDDSGFCDNFKEDPAGLAMVMAIVATISSAMVLVMVTATAMVSVMVSVMVMITVIAMAVAVAVVMEPDYDTFNIYQSS